MYRTRRDQEVAIFAPNRVVPVDTPQAFLRPVGRLRACPPARERFRTRWATSDFDMPVADLSLVGLGGRRQDWEDVERQGVSGGSVFEDGADSLSQGRYDLCA